MTTDCTHHWIAQPATARKSTLLFCKLCTATRVIPAQREINLGQRPARGG